MSVTPSAWALLRAAVVGALTARLLALGVAAPMDWLAPRAHQLVLAACSVLAATVLAPAALGERASLGRLLAWAVLAAAAFSLWSLTLRGHVPPALVGAVGLLVLFGTSLARALARSPVGHPLAGLTAAALLALAGSAPVWLGPLAESGGGDALLAASPLTYLALAADYDYLHAQWFYQWTPFGTIRYAYPDGAVLAPVYGLLGLALHGLAGRRRDAHAEAVPITQKS
jgi:hypothetical protein